MKKWLRYCWHWRRRSCRTKSNPTRSLLAQAQIIVGGARHFAMLPPDDPREKLPWTAPILTSIEAIMRRRGQPICILASGDPMCYGIRSISHSSCGACRNDHHFQPLRPSAWPAPIWAGPQWKWRWSVCAVATRPCCMRCSIQGRVSPAGRTCPVSLGRVEATAPGALLRTLDGTAPDGVSIRRAAPTNGWSRSCVGAARS